jgi:non-ribosomal peptide synthase protein (TIGR01720 family)
VPRVGIDDNYFSLGGDSIKAIQIVSRLLRRHLRMEIRDLFRHRTIRSLAPFAVEIAPTASEASRPRADGPPMLTAAQARFFAEHGAEPGRFHHAVLFDVSGRLDPLIVGQAFAAARDRHDALRLAFHPEPRVTPAGGPHPDVQLVTDLASVRPGLLAPFDLAGGQLHRVAIVRSRDRDQLLIVVHHLCIDGVSWRILIDDLGIALSAASTSKAPELPAVTDRPLEAARKLSDYGRSQAARNQLDYWKDVEALAAALVDPDGKPRARYRDRETLARALDVPATSALLVDANRAYGTTPEDLLLAALARAIHARFGAIATGVLLESHGRYPVTPGLDVSRTMGWFTSLFPFVLSLDPARDLGFQVKSMKEAIRAVPDHGIAYGLLRYLGGASLSLQPQVSFNYLGQIDAGGDAAPLRLSSEPVEGGVSPDAWALAEIEVSALAVAGQMRLMLAFNAKRFALPAMQTLLETWHRELHAIVEHCRQQAHTELTPADLSYSKLSVDELEDLFK